MTKRVSVTSREWAFVGLRMILPVSALLLGFGQSQILLGLAIIGIVTNLVLALLLLGDYWAAIVAILAIAIDVGLVTAVVWFGGDGFLWLGLIPTAAAGFYFEWIPATLVGAAMASAIVVVELARSNAGAAFNTSLLVLQLIGLPAAGAMVSFLKRNEIEMNELISRTGKAERAQQLAIEYMKVVYEMTSVLSASKLNPRRVLESAVEFGLDGLERVGLKPPLYGAILLFDHAEDEDLGPILRLAYASKTVAPSAATTTLFGNAGILADAFRSFTPSVSHSPANDPELRMLPTLQDCATVMCFPLRVGDETYGAFLVGSNERDPFRELHVELMRAVANQSVSSIHNARLYADLLRQRDRLVNIEKAARAQLASELHDGPTQGVSAIAMRLNYIRKLIERKPEVAVNEIYQIEDMARRTAREIRAMLFELRPKSLEDGLDAGLKQLAIKMKETYNQDVRVHVMDHADDVIDDHTRQTLFSIAVEAVNNARKHAGADIITIAFSSRGDTFVFEVSDDGVGFDVDKAIAESKRREGHLGLTNLFERAALIDGTMHVESETGKGSKITVLLPRDLILQRKQDEVTRQQQEEAELPFTH